MDRKVLYLIRHRQYMYDATSGEGSLTDLGREQARLTAQRMHMLPISAIYCSTLQRAVETADIIAAELPGVPLRRSHALCECIPCVPSDDAPTFADCTLEEIASGAEQCSKAFGRCFTRPRGNDRRGSTMCLKTTTICWPCWA
jgi:serine/threonine-protein phosphatase PGAM5